MTSKQAVTLRRLKAIENKAWQAAYDANIPKEQFEPWIKADAAVRSFAATLPIYGQVKSETAARPFVRDDLRALMIRSIEETQPCTNFWTPIASRQP